MRIEKVTINNFRNISHAEYNLGRINLFVGPNQTGKTNTILAIYWALTDFLMDGSTDYPSFKPHSDSKAEVSVELQFDTGLTFKKTYAEKWTKTRGSEEVTMTGHTTTYWIDGVKLKISEAKKELQTKLGISNLECGNFDLLRSIIDPYYFEKTVDWKTLRAFIIELCGDVSNADIFADDPMLAQIQPRLEKDNYDTTRTTKFLKSELKRVNEGIKENEGRVLGLKENVSPSESDVAHANSEIELLQKELQLLDSENGVATVSDDMKRSIREKELEIQEVISAEKDAVAKENASFVEQISQKSADLNRMIESSNRLLSEEIAPVDAELADIQARINSNELFIKSTEEQRQKLLKKYHEMHDNWQAPEGKKCPNCGYVLDQEYIDDVVAKHDADITECIEEGKKCNIKIAEYGFEIEDLKKKASQIKLNREQKSAEYELAKKSINSVQKEITALNSKKKYYSESEKVCQMREALDVLKQNLRDMQIQQSGSNEVVENRKNEIREQIEQYKQVLNLKAAYDISQSHIEKLESDISSSQKEVVKLENQIMLVEEFIQTKLKLFAEKISSVFGNRMKFDLIQDNIKEGSYNEVCIPKIVDKDTPFEYGSGSEQIITGIYFAECVKKKLGLQDLPYIFDECDKLDSAHLAALDTKSQIISTIVDDVNYSNVTLQTRE